MQLKEQIFLDSVLDIVSVIIKDNDDNAQLIGHILQCHSLAKTVYNYNTKVDTTYLAEGTAYRAINIVKWARRLTHLYLFNDIKQKEETTIQIKQCNISYKIDTETNKTVFTLSKTEPSCIESEFIIDMITLILLNLHTDSTRYKVCPKCGRIFYQISRRSQKYCTIECSNKGRSGKQFKVL